MSWTPGEEARSIAPPHLADQGDAPRTRWRRATIGGRIMPVRDAEDGLLLWQGSKAQLEQSKAESAALLPAHLARPRSADKTRLTPIEQGFTFLGYPWRRARHRSTRKQHGLALPSHANLRPYRAQGKRLASRLAVPDLTEVWR